MAVVTVRLLGIKAFDAKVEKDLVTPFAKAAMESQPLYLQEQEAARAGRRGLWASAEAGERALVMINEWRGATP